MPFEKRHRLTNYKTTDTTIRYYQISKACDKAFDCRVLKVYSVTSAQHVKLSRRQIILSNRGALLCRDVTSSDRI